MLVWRTRYDGILCIDELDDYVRTSSRTAVPFLETKLLGISVTLARLLRIISYFRQILEISVTLAKLLLSLIHI